MSWRGVFLWTREELRLQSIPLTRPGPEALEAIHTLAGGSNGRPSTPETYVGEDEELEKTGLKTFEDIEEISIVAVPGATADYTNRQATANAIVQALLIHCQIRMRYRVAVLDAPDQQILSEVRA